MNNLTASSPKVVLSCYTQNPEKVVATAAKLCYSSLNVDALQESVKEENQSSFINRIISLGHQSVLEHVSYTFLAEGISRAASHQLVRHRIASYSQRSQRYVREKDGFHYIIPSSLQQDSNRLKQFEEFMGHIFTLYNKWIDEGVPPEDARYILPNAAETKIAITMNARELRHFFSFRCCLRAQWEIRNLAVLMLRLVKQVSSALFENAGPACITGPCPEHEMSCGYLLKVREIFSNFSSYSDKELLENLNAIDYS